MNIPARHIVGYTFFLACSIRIGGLGCLLMMLLPFCTNEDYFGGHISLLCLIFAIRVFHVVN